MRAAFSSMIGVMPSMNMSAPMRSPSMREHPDTIRRAADGVEKQLNGSRYLLEDEFGLADITVASLLAPIVGPPQSPWAYEIDFPEFTALRQEFRARPVGDYVTRLYAERHA